MAPFDILNRIMGEVHAGKASAENAAMRAYDRLRMGKHEDPELQAGWVTHGEAAYVIRVYKTPAERARLAGIVARRENKETSKTSGPRQK